MQSRDISAFETALKAVDRRSNVILFSVLGATCVAALLYDGSGFRHQVIDVGGVLTLGSFIAYRIISLAKAKNCIATEFGLVCSACGKAPKALFAEDAIKSGRCPACGTNY